MVWLCSDTPARNWFVSHRDGSNFWTRDEPLSIEKLLGRGFTLRSACYPRVTRWSKIEFWRDRYGTKQSGGKTFMRRFTSTLTQGELLKCHLSAMKHRWRMDQENLRAIGRRGIGRTAESNWR